MQEYIRLPLKENTIIGDNTIKRVIGYGGSSLCYEAFSKQGRRVIIKEIFPLSLAEYLIRNEVTQAIEPKFELNEAKKERCNQEFDIYLDRQTREIKIAQSLRDPYNIDTPYIFHSEIARCEQNGMDYLVIDTEGGKMLEEIISDRNEDGTIKGLESTEQVFKLVRRILEAIEPIHNDERIHCDLSPDNIFVSDMIQDEDIGHSIVRAIDFNSTISVNENRDKLIFSYKSGFSPVELMDSAKYDLISYGTDLFSVAAVLFCMIYNVLFDYIEFSGNGYEDELKIYIESKYLEIISSKAKAKLQAILFNALIRRYNTIDTFKKDLDELIELSDPNNPRLVTGPIFYPSFCALGRDLEVEQINEKFSEFNTVFIKADGGIGKSELARMYAKKYENEYDIIKFVYYEDDLKNTVTNLPTLNFDEDKYDDDLDKIYQQKLKLLSDQTNKTLIIFENFNTNYDINLKDLQGLSCRFLFTTRNIIEGTERNTILLKELPKTDALKLFEAYYQRKDEETIQKVAHLLEMIKRNTLLLILIAKTMSRNGVSIDKVVSAFDNRKLVSLPEGVRHVVDYSKDTDNNKQIIEHLRIVFNLSELSFYCKTVLTNMTLLPADGVTLDSFIEMSWCDINDVNYLIGCGWIQCYDQTKSVSLHPVIADLVFEDLKPDASICWQYVLSLLEEIDKEKDFIHKKNLCSLVFAAIKGIGGNSIKISAPDSTDSADFYDIYLNASENIQKTRRFLELCDKTAHLLFDCARYRDALFCFLMEQNVCINTLGDNHYDTISVYNDLAATYSELGDFPKEMEYLSKVLVIRKKIYGENHPDTANAYHNVGTAYIGLGDNAKALEFYNKAKSIRDKLFDEDNLDTASSYICLGFSYTNSGRYDEAFEMYMKALSIYTNLYDLDHPIFAQVYNDLGALYRKTGEYFKAIEAFKKALSIKLKYYGEEHSDTATGYNNLADIYILLGENRRALELLNKALVIYKKFENENPTDIPMVYNNMATAHKNLGDFDQTLICLNMALEIYMQVSGKEHPDTALIYNNLGGLYYDKGDFNNSINNFNKSLKIYVKAYGEYHIDSAEAYSNIAGVYEKMHKYSDALETYRKAYKIYEKLYGFNHPETIDIAQRIRRCLIKTGL